MSLTENKCVVIRKSLIAMYDLKFIEDAEIGTFQWRRIRGVYFQLLLSSLILKQLDFYDNFEKFDGVVSVFDCNLAATLPSLISIVTLFWLIYPFSSRCLYLSDACRCLL